MILITAVGQNLGAGKVDRIRKGMKAALGIAIFTAAVIAACMIFFGRGILGCFSEYLKLCLKKIPMPKIYFPSLLPHFSIFFLISLT